MREYLDWNSVNILDNPELFQKQFTQFIKDRNHVAHNKLFMFSTYNIILTKITSFDESVKKAIEKFKKIIHQKKYWKLCIANTSRKNTKKVTGVIVLTMRQV